MPVAVIAVAAGLIAIPPKKVKLLMPIAATSQNHPKARPFRTAVQLEELISRADYSCVARAVALAFLYSIEAS